MERYRDEEEAIGPENDSNLSLQSVDDFGVEQDNRELEMSLLPDSASGSYHDSTPSTSASSRENLVGKLRTKRPWFEVLMKGPRPPKQPFVSMIFPKLQILPDVILKLMPRYRREAFWAAVLAWAALFYLLAKGSILASATIDNEPISFITCSVGGWVGKNNQCGLNGTNCMRPDGATFKFKCPADCIKESWTYSETPVGSYGAIYQPFVIGSDNHYRADSFICAAAVHHGVVSDKTGGCGIIRYSAETNKKFESSKQNGIESIGFDSHFPQSYSFEDTSGMEVHGCRDLRWAIITMNIVFSVLFGYFVSHAAGFFWPLFLMGFWTVILASNPPIYSGSDTELIDAELVSLGFRRLLPGSLAAYVIYISSVRPQLDGLKAHLSRTVFWLGGFWIGVLENFVFGALPLDRLTVHDLNAQAGAWAAVGTIVISIIVIAFGQAFVIWRAGKFEPYIKLYLGFALLLFILSLIPNQTLRIHHYILALIFLPGTGFRTTPSLLYQGLLVGLFVSGVSRWDFDSILQTYEQLRRGAPTLVGGLPTLLKPDMFSLTNATLSWESLTNTTRWDRFSLIINDVEWYRGPNTEYALSNFIESFTFDPQAVTKYYIRLAYAAGGGRTGDYTHAGVIDMVNMTWTAPAEGAI